ncbi:MAG: UbiA family prenyltransferase [Gemmatimonadales bacterium]|nr:UbiA family prenyltransferase [Gemmatimonadales bacterium]
MTQRRNTLYDAIALTRPNQWPILSGQFFVGVLLMAPAAQGGGCWLNTASMGVLSVAWICWVVMLNGGTLAFNSAHDQDEGPVAYLPDPPPPPSWLGSAALVWMLTGACLGWWLVGPAFGALVAVCVALSVLYSHRITRWKSRPGLDLLVNMLGYGIGTTTAGILAGRAAYLIGPDNGGSGDSLVALSACGSDRIVLPPIPAGDNISLAVLQAVASGGAGWFILGFGFLFGSLYPLTQLYQMEDDQKRGDRTLVSFLGTNRALRLAIALGLAAALAFGAGLVVRGIGLWSLAPLVAAVLWLGHLVIWSLSSVTYTATDHEQGMYRALALWGVMDITLLVAWVF